MNKRIITYMATIALTAGLSAGNLRGTWSGQLKVTPHNTLKIVFNIHPDSVTMDSPDQNAFGIRCDINHLSSDSINVKVGKLAMEYAGRLEKDSVRGTFRQGGFSIPLTLTPGLKKANRPQTPQAPFPYHTESVVVEAPEAMIAGTLTIPENADSDTPAVVFVSGSGLQNRDEEIFEHKPFAVIADFLARNGIASLRYDDRGCGESQGNNDTATTADYASDAEAVVEYLRRSGRFSKIGLIGHSEGGLIGYMLGARPGIIDFLVSIAGPSVSGAEINAYQNKVALMNSGVDSQTSEDFRSALFKALTYRINNAPLPSADEAILTELYPQCNDSGVTRKLGETITATLTMEKIKPWMDYFLRYDPAQDLRGLKIPSFIIYGERDCQVPPSLNVSPMQENAPGAIVKIYPELNHMMQHSVSGNVDEYKNIEETISPEVMADIVEFIKEKIAR